MSSTAAAPLADFANKMKGSSKLDDIFNQLLRSLQHLSDIIIVPSSVLYAV